MKMLPNTTSRFQCVAFFCMILLLTGAPHVVHATTGNHNFGGRRSSSLSFATQSRHSRRRTSDNDWSFPQGLYNDDDNRQQHQQQDLVQLCSVSTAGTLLRGAALRIASDLSGGTVLETIKTRTTTTTENPIQATKHIVNKNGVFGLWKGTPSRTIEGALIGAVFMLASSITKAQCRKMGLSPTVSALAAGLVGGVAQATIMTPAGLIFTALNGDESSQRNTVQVVRDVLQQKGVKGMYAGSAPMCIRQATNWASRSGFTEISRSVLGLSKYGLLGEVASGCLGGVGSCWNTPIETIRVYTQRDVSQNKQPKDMKVYWKEIYGDHGVPGLYRGFIPRAVQAVWQTTFLVVIPNLMGL